MHPPLLLGVIPANAGGIGDQAKALDSFYKLEIEPLQSVFLELNEAVGLEVVRFKNRNR